MHCGPSCDGRSLLWRLDLSISEKNESALLKTRTGVRWRLLARGARGRDSPSNGFEEGVADCGAHALKAMEGWRCRGADTCTLAVGSGTGACALPPTLPRGFR